MDLIRNAFPEGTFHTLTRQQLDDALAGASPQSIRGAIAAACRHGFLTITLVQTAQGPMPLYTNTR